MAKPMVKKGVQRILLCGFMGCGKTSVGQALSFRLKWEFLDTDAMIEKREGRKIPGLFAQDGDAAFRETCYRRIQTSDRPLVRNNTKEGLEEIFNARREKYLSVADVVIQNGGIISSTVEEIVENLAIL